MDHDRLFKELLTVFFVEFVELFLPDVAAYLDKDSIEFLDKEVFTDVTAGRKSVLNFQYRVIQLNRLNWRDYVRQPNPVASALMAKMRLAVKDRPKVKAQCLRLLATLHLDRARMQLISGFVDSYLELNAREQRIFER